MIEVKAFLGDWTRVDKEDARRFVGYIMRGSVAIPENRKADWVNKNHLRGTTVEKLFQ